LGVAGSGSLTLAVPSDAVQHDAVQSDAVQRDAGPVTSHPSQ
jgi:hypothetical protein